VRNAVAGIALSCGVLCPAPAAASTIAVDVTGGTFRLCNPQPEPGCSVGWAFEAHSPITVVSLAVFDRGSDAPVASADPGGRWLFRSIDPLTLDPATYVIVAFLLQSAAGAIFLPARWRRRQQRFYRRFRRLERTNRAHIPIPISAVLTGSGTVRSIASASSRISPEAPTLVTTITTRAGLRIVAEGLLARS
jgi:hypothetical protein